MPEYLAPGVYVEETSFRSKSIEGVATTTTGFVGPTRYGPSTMVPDLLTSLADFERVYGDGDPLAFTGSGASANYTWHAARAFFENGGRRLYVSRIVAADAATATGPVTTVAPAAALTGDGATATFTFSLAPPVVPGTVRLSRNAPANVVAGEDLGAPANGADTTFDRTLAHPANGSAVTLSWTSGGAPRSQTITGAVVTGDGQPGGTTLDRATGAVHLDTTGARPDAGTDLTADYEWDDTRVFADNGVGLVVGMHGAAGVFGSVDYATGDVSVTFADMPPNGEQWDVGYSAAAGDVTARFPGAAGNGTLQFFARAGQHRAFTAGALPAGVAVGDIVEVLRNNWRASEWRRIAGVAGAYTLSSLRAGDRAANNAATAGSSVDNQPLDGTIIRVAKAASVTVVFTRAGQTDPAGIWDGLAPTPDAITEHFSATPSSDERARTLPVIVASVQDSTLHGGSVTLTGGTDGTQPDGSAYEGREDPVTDVKTGLKAFEDIEDISIVAAPGLAGLADADQAAAGVLAIQAHVERMRYRVGVIDSVGGHSISEVRQFRARFDSTRLALYYPWVRVLDPVTKREINLPPSGFVTGIYARNDINRAVYKAPANEVVNLALGFERTLNKAQQEVLNPEGINCLRFFEGRGMRVWGARTMSSDPEWKYVNVRRYFAYLEHSIDRGTQWAVFEPNSPLLWGNVRRTIEDFLLNEFQSGALLGDKPEKAFFVRCDRSTMTQNDLDNGRLICLIGVAPLKPAEFVIFRIGQWTADAKK